MNNEEKASEIVIEIHKPSSLDYDGRRAKYMYESAMEMAKWKDEQAKEQRKKLIEKAKEYLSIVYDFVASEQAKKETNKKKVIEGLIKAMEDEK